MRFKTVLIVMVALFLCGSSEALASGEGYSNEQWKEFFLKFLNFGVLLFFIYKFSWKLVSSFFKNRRKSIADTEKSLNSQVAALEEQNKILLKKLEEIEQKRPELIESYKKQAEQERERILIEAQTSADQIIQKTQTAMNQELLIARRILLEEASNLSIEMAKTILTKNFDKNDQLTLVNNFVDQVSNLSQKNQKVN